MASKTRKQNNLGSPKGTHKQISSNPFYVRHLLLCLVSFHNAEEFLRVQESLEPTNIRIWHDDKPFGWPASAFYSPCLRSCRCSTGHKQPTPTPAPTPAPSDAVRQVAHGNLQAATSRKAGSSRISQGKPEYLSP